MFVIVISKSNTILYTYRALQLLDNQFILHKLTIKNVGYCDNTLHFL